MGQGRVIALEVSEVPAVMSSTCSTWLWSITSFFIRVMKVVRLSPRRAAALFRSPIRPSAFCESSEDLHPVHVRENAAHRHAPFRPRLLICVLLKMWFYQGSAPQQALSALFQRTKSRPAQLHYAIPGCFPANCTRTRLSSFLKERSRFSCSFSGKTPERNAGPIRGCLQRVP